MLLATAAFSGSSMISDQDWEAQRQGLVSELSRQGITDKNVLEAINQVPRHQFVPEKWRRLSYINNPLPIGNDQTISQPFIVAYMCQELKLTKTDNVLEIGTGSGYHAAVMSHLCSYVYSIEIIPELGNSARQKLDSLGYENIEVLVGDGYQGWPEHAPFDAIILTAAPPQVPQPLLDQMKIGGRLIAPVGVNYQELVLIERTKRGYRRTTLIPVRFVPMTGEAEEKKH